MTSILEIEIDEKLSLREIQVTDAPAIFDIIDLNREYLRQWLPFVDSAKKVENIEGFIKNILGHPYETRELTYVIIYENVIVGLIGFVRSDKANKRTEIGYWLAEDCQGNGIVTTACQTLVDAAFRVLNVNRVQIKVARENEKSRKIPQRLGFVLEGVERQGEWVNDRFHDLELYSLLRPEWQKRKA